MKIRNGFVSNSSSSSFVIFGNNINIEDATNDMIGVKNLYFLGDWLNEGQDVLKINTIEELAFIKSLYKLKNTDDEFVLVNSYVFSEDDSDEEFDLSILPKTGNAKIFSGNRDYNSAYDIGTLKNRYDKNGDVSKDMIKYLRSTKINDIEKINKI